MPQVYPSRCAKKGRFAPLTAGLDLSDVSDSRDVALLFVGLSDPRHLVAALHGALAVKRWRCAMNAPWMWGWWVTGWPSWSIVTMLGVTTGYLGSKMGYWKEKTCQSIMLKKVSMTDYHQLSWKIKIWSEVTVWAGGGSELKYHGYHGVLQPVIFGLAALHWQGEMLPAQEPNAFASSLVSSKRFEKHLCLSWHV